MIVIVALGIAGGEWISPDWPTVNGYLKAADVDAFDGRGSAEFTTNPAEAMTFPDMATAFAYWRRTSTVRPRRPDGKPNRPLTAYTVEFATVPGASE